MDRSTLITDPLLFKLIGILLVTVPHIPSNIFQNKNVRFFDSNLNAMVIKFIIISSIEAATRCDLLEHIEINTADIFWMP